MKITFAIFSCLLFTASIFAQDNFLIKGKVLDQNALFPLEGVSIFEKSNQENGTYSNKDGSFKLRLSNPNSTLVFSFLGYETTYKPFSANDKEAKIIFLKPDIYQLPKVEISAELELEPMTDSYESVVDFVFWKDRILWLKKQNNKGHILVLAEESGAEIDQLSLKGKGIRDIESLSKSCFGTLHLVCLNYGFQIDIIENSISLNEKYTRREYNFLIKPCLAQIDNSVVFKKELYNGLISEFYTADAGGKWNDVFKVAAEESLLRSYQEDHGLMTKGQTKGNATANSTDENCKIRSLQAQSDFLQRILYKGIRIPLFKRNDTLLIFNYYENQLQFFDKFGNQLAAKNIDFHLNKKWDKRVIFDEKTGKLYAIFNNKNGRFLSQINIQTGACAPPIHLESVFIKKMAVHDDVLYLLHVERTEPNWILHQVRL